MQLFTASNWKFFGCWQQLKKMSECSKSYSGKVQVKVFSVVYDFILDFMASDTLPSLNSSVSFLHRCHEGKYMLKKSRRTDVEDLTPNPRKLLQIGTELRKLNKVISDLTPVSELPLTARPRSRKEKNKLASRWKPSTHTHKLFMEQSCIVISLFGSCMLWSLAPTVTYVQNHKSHLFDSLSEHAA